jgi:hypothetical protein
MTKSTVQYPADLRKKLKPSLSRAELEREIARRLYLLFRHYKIDPASKDAGVELGSRLMMDHVPGFQVGGLRGAPNKSDTIEAKDARRWLIGKIEEAHQRNPRLSDIEICKNLVRDSNLPKHFRKADGRPKSHHTLRAAIPLARHDQLVDELVREFMNARQPQGSAMGPEKKFES